MVIFYLLVLGTGIWASFKSRRKLQKSTAGAVDATLLGNRSIKWLLGIFTMTGEKLLAELLMVWQLCFFFCILCFCMCFLFFGSLSVSQFHIRTASLKSDDPSLLKLFLYLFSSPQHSGCGLKKTKTRPIIYMQCQGKVVHVFSLKCP